MAKDVKKRPNGRWEARLRRNGNYLGAKVFDTRKEAEAWAQMMLAQHTDGVDLRRANRSVKDYVEEFHTYREQYTNAQSATRKTDRNMFKRIPGWFLELKVGKVETRHIEKVLFDDAKENPGRTTDSITRGWTTLSAFFKYLVKQKVIVRNPATGADKPKGRLVEEVIPWMGPEIFERYAVWKGLNQEMADVALVTYFLALRWGEVRALSVKDVRIKNFEEVYVWRSWSEGEQIKDTKTEDRRWVPVMEDIRPILQKLAEGRADGELLFAGLTRAKFKWRLKWKETAQGKVIHSLRHGGITTWVEAGVLAPVAMRWSGHKKSKTFDRYTHLVGNRVNRTAIDQLNQFAREQRRSL
ncbi:tyrosine-type recombinase/integrase [Leucobacter aridicollis]|uniref:tyrosine-type recombinase/integrase n=1 Tax=Leucobacter aridicollis TaxID=283878 RepID=UPI002167AD29|nr:tyrosine-type recombinase/integrase [Leucobacter aridicollis]MCS3429045.1 integrase [Leucobacter aridicollis]